MNEQLIDNLRKHQLHAGTWLGLGSAVTTEIAARIGFDWLLIDLEHGLGTESVLLSQLQAASQHGSALIVRVGHIDASLITRALDWGAHGIMLPQVDNAEKARACLELMLYPPHGRRGYSSSARVYGFGLERSSPANQPQPFFMVQIETLTGVQHAGEIAALPGVDVLFIGPTDLKADIDAVQPTDGITIERCIDEVIEAAAKHGKQTGIVLKTPVELAVYREKGIHFLSFGSDLMFVREGMKEACKELRQPK